ncbi:hypothetical protein SLS60_003110 [Paraconiothyrium brasiliense]|uniref:Uncharacterized protein n=1 Tax=Paraconiothyrium brasiliense TaxID=300254 RepID=A0ABR3RUQ9_9PLEO
MDRRSESSVEDGEIKSRISDNDDGAEEALAGQSAVSLPAHHSIYSGYINGASAPQATQVFRPQAKGEEAGHLVKPGRDAAGTVTLNGTLPASSETLGSNDQLSSTYLSEAVDASTVAQSLKDIEQKGLTSDEAPGLSSAAPVIKVDDLTSSDRGEAKAPGEKHISPVEDGSNATGSSPEDTPKSGDFTGEANGYPQDVREAINSRAIFNPSGDAITLSHGIHTSKVIPALPVLPYHRINATKYAPSTPQHNRVSHAGAFVQKFENLPRAPRRPQFNNGQQYYDRSDPRDETRMLQSQLRKANQTLEDERKVHKAEFERTETRIRQDYEATLQQITSSIFGQRVALFKETVHLKERELDLEARESLIGKTEHLLAIGQKQYAGADADHQDLETFLDINDEIIRERVTHEIGRRDRKVDAQLAIKKGELKTRETAIDMREKAYSAMYKIQVSERIETRIRAELEHEMSTRENAEYERGLAEGKALGQAEGSDQLRRNYYDQGFAACHNMFDRIKRFQAGLPPHQSLHLDELGYPMPCSQPADLPIQVGPSAMNNNGKRIFASARSYPQAHINDHANGHTGPANGNDLAASAKPHPYADIKRYANGHVNGANDIEALSASPRDRQKELNAFQSHNDLKFTEDITFGVPKYSTRSAPRPLHPSFLAQTPQTPTSDNDATEGKRTTGDRTEGGIARPNIEVPTFLTGNRLFYGCPNSMNEKVHKEDKQAKQADLIDLY